jgi:serine/threonine-protein kinase
LSDRVRLALQDRYSIDREIGQGSAAVVFQAEDRKHHRLVAIKVLRPEVAAEIGVDRFVREIETVARLAHPHILPLFDSGEADGLPYFVMPFVPGESLRDRILREQQLPVEDAMEIARNVASALGYAHSHGIVHRDIKPANILLAGGHAIVADFGVARAISAAIDGDAERQGEMFGTPLYMSPEQLTGSSRLDGRSDLYSLGCVLYEMLAGHPPFQGRTTEEVRAQHLLDAPP